MSALKPIENTTKVRGVPSKAQRYLARHPEARAWKYAARKARLLGVINTLKVGEWRNRISEFDGACAYCFAPYECMDHVIAMAKGGPNSKENVVPACNDCNSRKDQGGGWTPSIASLFWPAMAEGLYT